ncbi:MAG: hypothetical protein V4440_04490 [Pseudomonadota bacterium]
MNKTITIDLAKLAEWLKAQGSDNYEGNAILDGIEELYRFETELAEYFPENKEGK